MAADIGLLGDDRIGRFRIVRVVSRGHASEILEVVEDGSGRRFALKELAESHAVDPADRRAFEYEARLGMDLSHPNLVRVYEFVRGKRRPYFVMEYFPSQHLRLPLGRPKEYPLSGSRRHKVLEQAGRALAYLHDRGYVHRDVKPENILFNKSGEARLIDYGLTRKVRTGLARLLGGKVPRQGTLSYIAPEQIRTEPPTPSADIYSFGIVCYEMGCGRQPFRADSASELLRKHLNERPSLPTAYNDRITPEYSDLVMRMIQKRPELRPASLHEFLSQFARIRIYQDDPDPQAGRDPG